MSDYAYALYGSLIHYQYLWPWTMVAPKGHGGCLLEISLNKLIAQYFQLYSAVYHIQIQRPEKKRDAKEKKQS